MKRCEFHVSSYFWHPYFLQAWCRQLRRIIPRS